MTGTMEVMHAQEGDIKTVWDSDNAAEVEAARQQFDALRAKRFQAFRVDKRGDRAERMDRFDPDAESIIMVPPIAGG